ncbi:MAG: CCA tRNA nucleotidyltransferase, partial [Xanthobacteraceae bacterium]
NAEAERLMALEGWWRVEPGSDGQAARALLYRLGSQSFTDQVLLAWSRSAAGAADPAWHKLADLPVRWPVPVFPLKAADFIQRGIGPGPALGAALRAAEKAWIAADFPGERGALEMIADKTAREVATDG